MIIIYTKDNCPACIQAKSQMDQAGTKYKEINIGKDITREEFMAKFPMVRTVPYTLVEMEPPEIKYV